MSSMALAAGVNSLVTEINEPVAAAMPLKTELFGIPVSPSRNLNLGKLFFPRSLA